MFPDLYLPIVTEANLRIWHPWRWLMPTATQAHYRKTVTALNDYMCNLIRTRWEERQERIRAGKPERVCSPSSFQRYRQTGQCHAAAGSIGSSLSTRLRCARSSQDLVYVIVSPCGDCAWAPCLHPRAAFLVFCILNLMSPGGDWSRVAFLHTQGLVVHTRARRCRTTLWSKSLPMWTPPHGRRPLCCSSAMSSRRSSSPATRPARP